MFVKPNESAARDPQSGRTVKTPVRLGWVGERRGQPDGWRVGLAFIFAPLLPAAAAASVTLFDGLPNGGYLQWVALFAAVGGYPAALILGLPTFLFLRSRLPPRLSYVTLAGGFVAATPWLLLVLFGSNPDVAIRGEQIVALDGAKTIWGWLDGLRTVAGIFLLGLLGGATFWFTAVWGGPTGAQPASSKGVT